MGDHAGAERASLEDLDDAEGRDPLRRGVEVRGARVRPVLRDRVSLDAAGRYTFIGRLDRQIKRRGFRIELGAIEAALARHDAVLEAAAVSWDNRGSGTAIAAFVRVRSRVQSNDAFSLIDAKAHCARLLPNYMLPDRIVFVDAIPKGNHGKIDYAALKRIVEEP